MSRARSKRCRATIQIATFGPNVDQSTQNYTYEYEQRGMLDAVLGTGNTGGSSVYSYVAMYYDAFEHLALEAQVFNTSPGSGIDQSVAYANAGNAGNSNTVRRTSITYPYNTGSRVVTFNYNSGDDSALDRVSSLSFTGAIVAAWQYFGLASVAETQYGAGAINSTLASGSSYPGLDLFGRIINLPWMQSSTVLAQLNYGYDQASNRTYRQDAKAGTNFDELYSYDAMHRLQSAARGTFSSPPSPLTGEGWGEGALPPITNPTLQQGWRLDATGNWTDFNNFDLVTASSTLVQQRASNAANEITGISATVGPAWQTPAYDRNGNMTTIPEPLALASGYTGIWDAWNRLIYLQSGDENVEFCLYDGLNRRVMRNQYSGGELSEQRFFIHSDQWQVLEEYVAATSLTVPAVQWVWGQRYIDDCVLRDSNSSGTLNLRLYALQDANWNGVALYNSATSAVVERYAYTPYGVVLFLNNSFDPLSGNVSAYSWETLYCGYRYDATPGLYPVRNRWPNPLLGCWLSRDPANFEADPNSYRYIGGNPANSIDTLGLEAAAAEPDYRLGWAVTEFTGGLWGSFTAKYTFSLSPPAKAGAEGKPSQGLILQHVNVTFEISKCGGNAVKAPIDDGRWNFWQAWRVLPGGTGPAAAGNQLAIKLRMHDDLKNTTGKIEFLLAAAFFPNTAMPAQLIQRNPALLNADNTPRSFTFSSLKIPPQLATRQPGSNIEGGKLPVLWGCQAVPSVGFAAGQTCGHMGVLVTFFERRVRRYDAYRLGASDPW